MLYTCEFAINKCLSTDVIRCQSAAAAAAAADDDDDDDDGGCYARHGVACCTS